MNFLHTKYDNIFNEDLELLVKAICRKLEPFVLLLTYLEIIESSKVPPWQLCERVRLDKDWIVPIRWS